MALAAEVGGRIIAARESIARGKSLATGEGKDRSAGTISGAQSGIRVDIIGTADLGPVTPCDVDRKSWDTVVVGCRAVRGCLGGVGRETLAADAAAGVKGKCGRRQSRDGQSEYQTHG